MLAHVAHTGFSPSTGLQPCNFQLWCTGCMALDRPSVCLSVCRIIENGRERVEVEEDGELKSIHIDGEKWHCRLNC